MPYTAGLTAYGGFVTQRIDNGVATFADTLPTCVVIRNGVIQGTTVTVVATAQAGAYTYSFVIPAWTDGDSIVLLASATVAGTTGRAVVDSFELGNSGGGGGGGGMDWSAMERQQIRDALGVDGTKTTAVSGQLQSIKTKTDLLTFTGSDVRATLDGELVQLDPSQVITFAGSVNATVGEILRGVWSQSAGKWHINPTASPNPTLTLYAPDDVTPLIVFDLTGYPYTTRTPQ